MKRFFESRLLSGRNQLSAPEKDAILKEVLARSAGTSSISGRGMRVALAAVAAGTLLTVGFLIAVEIRSPDDPATEKDHGFMPRGGTEPTHFMALRCVTSQIQGRCVPGDKLVFQVRGTPRKQWFSAFSTRDGKSSVIWYFPETPDGQSIRWRSGDRDGWLSSGVMMGSEHGRGKHVVYGIFSSRPLSRQDIRALFKDGAPPDTDEVVIVRKYLQVESN